jgi:hypothetical protein
MAYGHTSVENFIPTWTHNFLATGFNMWYLFHDSQHFPNQTPLAFGHWRFMYDVSVCSSDACSSPRAASVHHRGGDTRAQICCSEFDHQQTVDGTSAG